ncbi:phosphate-induced protein 1 [Mycotypha africana]|uniref:phosphate-induced protein 1 n=1 Tax=Mycotypha africana TaxID=64632 RepID=UPI0023017612|nr:phosphate-induced protein 1 [Mycotypha africana]KAI8967892.1 phosphate-induced protein 1 [Mycotypha africana]
MKLFGIATFLFCTFHAFVLAQQAVQNGSTVTPVISQYSNLFQNTGGKVLHDKVNVYIIFYGNWSAPQNQQEQNIFMQFIDNISTSSWFNLLKQYSDSDGHSVTGPLNLAAAVNDAGSHSLNLTNSVHKQIIIDAVNSGYLSPTNRIDSNGVYIIMGGPDVADADFCKSNCGYNSYSDEFQYMFIGYPSVCPETCIPTMNKNKSPNNSPAIDAAITIFSHEIQDILTDPRGDAWVIKTGDNVDVELGDFCSSQGTSSDQFGNLVQTQSGSYNLELNNMKYLVQTIFDLESKQCKLDSS